MSKTSTVTIAVTVQGDGISPPSTYVPPSSPLVNFAAPENVPAPLVLTSGDNAITIPPGSTRLLIEPPVGNVTTIKLGLAADTGWPCAPTGTKLLDWPTGTTTVHIDVGANLTVAASWC